MLAVTTIGSDGYLVGKDPVGGPLQVPDPVGTLGARGNRGIHDGMGPAAGISPQFGVIAYSHPQKDAVIVVGGVNVLDLAPSMDRGGEVFLTVLHPLDRFSQFDSEYGRDNRFRIGVDLTSEPAANVSGQDPKLVLRKAEDLRYEAAFQVGRLSGQPHGHVASAPFIAGNDGSRLHGTGHQARLGQSHRHHSAGIPECAFGVTGGPRCFDAQVCAQVLVDQWRVTPGRRLYIDHGGKRLVVYFDQL